MKSMVLACLCLSVLIAFVACSPVDSTADPKKAPAKDAKGEAAAATSKGDNHASTHEPEGEAESPYSPKPGDKADHNDGSYKNKRDTSHISELEDQACDEKKGKGGGDKEKDSTVAPPAEDDKSS